MNLATYSPTATRPVSSHRWWLCSLLILLLVIIAPLAGCATRGKMVFGNFNSSPPVFTFNSSKSEVFSHINRTSQHVNGWRSVSCRISARGVPVKLKAIVACESPKRFRMVVSTPVIGRQLDLGSNNERFWFWANEGPERPILTASHQNLATAQQNLPIPFNPDWLMEIMGVVPFDESGFQMTYKPEDATINLVSSTSDPQGRTVYRRIIVNAQTGLVNRHEMYGPQRELIASATMENYRAVGPQQVVMPHHIQLDWPQTEMAFKLDFPTIEINPVSAKTDTGQWDIPRISDTVVDIGRTPVIPVSLPHR
ncbi:hypothetical protein Pla110_35890 [Polystyrenella longa]|uniref:Outer membrane lipoprotein-sorting protein n=1 Tax=Polystyrenella longa TaxID=2528007 RepID=A0A518CRJ6_9PLAN|nr:hypothetical protein [Polystyrenella longa]QDU81838.1 hypothetical protein Pla110_35890 [Polystyrenella longa]